MSMVVVYDGGGHSDVLLKATSWLEHSGRFRVSLISLVRGGGGGGGTIRKASSVSMAAGLLEQPGCQPKGSHTARRKPDGC